MSTKLVLFALVLVLLGPLAAFADDDDDNDNDHRLQAVPFIFIAEEGECGELSPGIPYPAGSRIVTSAWLGGMGLPDNGGPNFNTATPSDPPNKRDPHLGLLLNKNGSSAVCSAAGAEIKRVKGMTVNATFTLGYDFRNGGHCGAGAPRFNVDTDMGFFFVGCAAAPKSQAPQDPSEWTRTRSVLTTCGSECSPGPIPLGARIKSINIIFDEGTEVGVGLAVLDNIDINGREIRKGSGIEDGINRDRDNYKHDNDDDDDD